MTDLRRHVPPLTLVWDDEAPGALHRTVDGTLVFADVSGFTALTERLSLDGRSQLLPRAIARMRRIST